ncbi:Rqc2 family fibronectin-binding protein [Alicyclobacillus fastidiosus]|uniref:Rqc2 homolog RqcH n=1 Tax=Alicyclobacillus fastidiosus TaxID=392011 RepID=A0ABV5AHE8_9BACL|nr:NFACT RNA binding domain-containing protein [Alicyclobacillus fastidiosus]WEH08089.1 NFACT RNA binding domain-containing protein [Alicyclobacillus fastidiosus]
MDGLTMRRLALELHEQLAGSKIEKIYQPGERDLLFALRMPGRPVARLFISAHKQFARVHLLQDERPENPKEPPMFCMLVRKYLEGGRVVKIAQRGWDRILEISIEAIDEVGDLRTYVLVCETMGRNSNIILCRTDDEGQRRIIDAVVRVTEHMSRVREVLPGAPYALPPAQDKSDIRDLSADAFAGLHTDDLTAKANEHLLLRQVAGIGPTSAREILYRAAAEGVHQLQFDAPTSVYQVARRLIEAVEAGSESSTVSLDDMGRATECEPFLLTHRQNYALCPSISEAIRRRFADNGEVLYHSHLQDELRRAVSDHLDKLRGKLVKLKQSLEQSADESLYRMKAELLTAFAHQVEKGQSRCTLPNYYEDNQPVAIDLDPSLDAIQNAQRYFKQATKRKRAAHAVAEQLDVTQMDIRYLEDVEESLRDASLENLEQVRRELISQGFLQEKAPKRKAKNQRQGAKSQQRIESRPDEFVSTDGFLIRVGRNNLQNDRLTFRQSDGRDLWLHVKDQPGSHVVIRRETAAEIPESTVDEAALLAAYFSRGRDSATVPVDITEVRHIWKPNGARPGLALYDNQTTVYVTPDRTLLEPILSRTASSVSGA